jgi:hypothetical protein
VFYYSRDRTGEHPQRHLAGYAGIFQADAYGGYNKLYAAGRQPGLILEAACWVHARRSFFVLADLAAGARRKAQGKTPAVISPIALAAVRRIDALFDIEREINGHSADQRRAVRQDLSAPLVVELEAWMRQERARLSRHNDVAQAMDYMLKRWTAFTRFLDDGRICLSNNAAERSGRGIALGRRAWLFAGPDRGGQRAAFMYSRKRPVCDVGAVARPGGFRTAPLQAASGSTLAGGHRHGISSSIRLIGCPSAIFASVSRR